MSLGQDPPKDPMGNKCLDFFSWELIHQQSELSGFKGKEAKHLPPLVIDTAMKDIRWELEAMSEMQDFPRMLNPKGWFGGELEHLINSAFAITALKDWVFLTDFPRGWDELRCLDFGAFENHMKRPYFVELLDRTARQLACRLSRILSILFNTSLATVEHDYSFHIWGEDSDSSDERQYHYEKLFRTALQLKADSVITDDTYTFEFSLSQKYINSAIAEPDSPEGSWSRLSICAYGSRPPVSQYEKESALVQTRNFLPSVTEQWFCDLQRNLYLVEQSYKTRVLMQSNRDPINAATRSDSINQAPGEVDLYSQEPRISEVSCKNRSAGEKVPITAPLSKKTSKNFCKLCKKQFQGSQGLATHSRNGTCRRCTSCKHVFSTCDDLKQHMKNKHMDQIESPNSSSVADDREESLPAMPSAPKQGTSSNTQAEVSIRGDDLDSYSINSSGTAENEMSSPDIRNSQVSDSGDSVSKEQPQSSNWPHNFKSTGEMANPGLLPIIHKDSSKSLDIASEGEDSTRSRYRSTNMRDEPGNSCAPSFLEDDIDSGNHGTLLPAE
ncbi:hypothetical protein DSL72_009009 [Monilinia vaccinii-corymbosi]|uniref:C2H2-type domain-containing protein n=1 Tax=Monilinia vaccinii-corymbosi TaxID=61207 RepID=A0A8A3PPT3_9HELO|nr:hypothetical protein DSL72_009009 [Monilinia vaccinii-corymbosi]